MQQVASQNAPSPAIIIPHFVFGGLAWLIVAALIFLFPEALTQHYFNPKLLAMTHLLVLGWITMIIFGTLYQLIPVIMEVKLYSEILAVITFILLATGSVLLALSFWNYWIGTMMYFAATILLAAVSLFLVNVWATAKKSSKKGIEKTFIQTSSIWLLFTVVAGIALAINLAHPFISPPHPELLKLHAHTGIIGWIIQLIMGVGSKLLPMFMVSPHLHMPRLKIVWYLLNFGLLAGIFALFFQWYPVVVASVVIVTFGIIFFLFLLAEAFRKRVKKGLDIGMKQSAFSFLMLVIPVIIIAALLLEMKQLNSVKIPMMIAYGSTLLIGFISSLIMGQTYKTLPFIIWLRVYRTKVGKEKIPFPKDLYSERVALLQLWSFATGFAILLAGVLMAKSDIVSLGGMILLFSVLLYNLNLLIILTHRVK